MSNVEKNLLGLIKALIDSDVKFVVCGGVACVLHGVDRNTYDVDISVELGIQNLKKILDIALKFDLYPRIPEPPENILNEEIRKKWIETKGALVYTFIAGNSPLQMDIFLKYPKTYEELYSKSDLIIVDNYRIPVSSIDDLIYAKEHVKPLRSKDKTDIEDLKRINERKS